jgi:hypothetical protein
MFFSRYIFVILPEILFIRFLDIILMTLKQYAEVEERMSKAGFPTKKSVDKRPETLRVFDKLAKSD